MEDWYEITALKAIKNGVTFYDCWRILGLKKAIQKFNEIKTEMKEMKVVNCYN